MKPIIIILLLSGLLTGCGSPEETGNQQQRANEPIENRVTLSEAQLASFERDTVRVSRRGMRHSIRLNGKADVPPQSRVAISQALGGHVREIRLLPGQSFRKGQVLAVLENPEYVQLQQDYLVATASLKQAGLHYARQQTLNESQAASDKSFQAAAAEYETLRITQRALAEKLRLVGIDPARLTADNITRRVQLHAPFDGVVGDVFVKPGSYVSPTDALLEVINPADLLAELNVFEKDWQQLAVGQELTVYTNGHPDRAVEGTVIAKSNHISEGGMAVVHAQLRRPQVAGITPGMYVNAELEVENREAYVLPDAAVMAYGGSHYVFEILDNHTFGLVEVQPGVRHGGFVEILEGQQLEGGVFVGKGAYTLLMALKNKAEE